MLISRKWPLHIPIHFSSENNNSKIHHFIFKHLLDWRWEKMPRLLSNYMPKKILPINNSR